MSELKLSVDQGYGYPAGPLELVDEDTCVHECGNGLVVRSLSSSRQEFLWNQQLASTGVSAFAVNARSGLIAVAEKGVKPKVTVFSFPDGNEVVSCEDLETECEVAVIALSRDGSRMFTGGSVTDYTIGVHNLSDGTLIPGCSEVLGTPCFGASFNPRDINMICGHGPRGLYFWKITQTGQNLRLRRKNAVLDIASGGKPTLGDTDADRSPRAASEELGGEQSLDAAIESVDTLLKGNTIPGQPLGPLDPKQNWLAHVWLLDGTVLASNAAGSIVKFDPTTGRALESWNAPENAPVGAMVVTQAGIVLGCADGRLRWVHPVSMNVERVVTLPGVGAGNTGLRIVSLAPSPSFSRLYIGASNGSIHWVSLLEDEEEEDSKATTLTNTLGGSRNEAAATPVVAAQVLAAHVGAVTSLVMLPRKAAEEARYVSGGVDGTLRLCDFAKHKTLGSLALPRSDSGALTVVVSLTVHHCLPLVIAGCTNGFVYAVTTAGTEAAPSLQIVASKLVHQGPVTAVSFAPESNIFCTGGQDGNFTVIRWAAGVDNTGDVLRVIGFARPNTGTILQLTWRGLYECLIGTASTELLSVSVSSELNAVDDWHPQDMTAAIIRRGIIITPSCMVVDCPTTLAARVPYEAPLLLVSGSDKALVQFDLLWQPDTADGKGAQASVAFDAHERGVLALAVSPAGMPSDSLGALVATGCADGTVAVWVMQRGQGGTEVIESYSVRAHSQAVTCVAFSRDGRRLLSASVDGTVFCYTLSGDNVPQPAVVDIVASLASFDAIAAVTSLPTLNLSLVPNYYFSEQAARLKEEAATQQAAVRAAYKKEVAMLGYQLKDLLTKNERAPELEQLRRDEFVVDVVGRDRILATGTQRAETLRTQLERANAERDIIARRIREECWDQMAVPGLALHAMQSGQVVHNFPVRKQSQVELDRVKRVLTLRRIELREIVDTPNSKRLCWPGLLAEVPADTNYIVNAGVLRAKADPCEKGDDGKSDGKKGDGEEDHPVVEAESKNVDVMTLPLAELLYHPNALRTANQKRSQIVMLKELIRTIETTFNQKVSKLLHAKEEEADKIAGRNARIEEILAELKDQQDYFKARPHPDEQPKSVLEVTQAEIGFERYVTEAERKALEEEAARKAAAAAAAKDDAPQRALQDMMGGTLEAKDELSLLEQTLHREAWMDELTEDQMSEEQRKALAEFEERVKLIEEEKVKHRKALELELKKLRAEVAEIVAAFDAQVETLFQQRLATKEAIHVQELYITRLAMSVQEREDMAIREELLLNRLDDLCDVRDAAAAAHQQYSDQRAQYADELAQLQEEEVKADRGFKGSIQIAGVVDDDTMKILLQLYKKRVEGGGVRSSVVGSISAHPRHGAEGFKSMYGGGGSQIVRSDIPSQDPFGDVVAPVNEQLSLQAEREAALAPLNLDTDCPEGFAVDSNVWNELQALRRNRIELELAVHDHKTQLAEMDSTLVRLADDLQRAEDRIADVENERELLLEQRAISGSNLELLLKLPQGQDEVANDGVVTDYSDALVINRAVVEGVNSSIVGLGNTRVGILTKIMNFRKAINKMLCHHRLLEATARDAEEHYTDLHMLRVTKTLQEFIKGGDMAERQRHELEKADAKLAHLKKSHEQQVLKLKQQAKAVAKQIKEREAENKRLQEQLAQLAANVAVRDSIHRSREQSRGGASDSMARSTARMKSITTRRKLVDLAKGQTEEIEFLRQELDRLRQSTFPSFAHTSRLHAGNVDEYQ